MRVKTSKQKNPTKVDYIEIYSGGDTFRISEPKRGYVEIEKVHENVFNPIQVHPRYANQIIIK